MLFKIKILCTVIALSFGASISSAQQINYPPLDRVGAAFKKLLERPRVPLNPSFDITKTDSVIIEHGFIYSEKNERVPILIYKPVIIAKLYPAVIFLHGTGGKKEDNIKI